MLSAAHVLAMDAKNLLDVVDSVRIRHPDLFVPDESQLMNPSFLASAGPSLTSAIPSDPIYGEAKKKK